ncbi:MAG TPA: AAA family ATPase [Anaerolineae bacterium]|nr:AAA family ATPase [Anaerolineae bacterium]
MMPDTAPPAVDPGVIILLNGTSSSGKTSLVRALQDILDLPLLDAGIDKFLWMLPKRYLNPPLWDDVLGRATEAGVTGQRLMSGMHHTIAALARTGNHVVADHVLVDPRWLQECACLFCDLPAYLIAVRCPLDVLEQREQQRQDRTLGQARAQFDLVHVHGVYDLEVDTSLASPEQCARQVVELLRSGMPPQAFKILVRRQTSSAR